MINGDYKLLVLDESKMITKFVKKLERRSGTNEVAFNLSCSIENHCLQIAWHVFTIIKQIKI